MMKTLLPLILLILLAAGCTGSQDPPQVGPGPSPSPSPSASAEPAPAAPAVSEPPASCDYAAPVSDEAAPLPYDYTAPVPETAAVDDGWFSGAVFIGDSRTEGLQMFGGIEYADFICHKGLSVFHVMNGKPVIETDGGAAGVLQVLEQKEYQKIYVMLGINELGYDNNSFADTYGAMVDRLKELEPDADIYLQSLVPVNEERCRETGQSAYITNEQIAVYNEIIAAVAAEKEVYYVNVKEAMTDESGQLPADASSDGIHFRVAGYQLWYGYLKTHTVEEKTQ